MLSVTWWATNRDRVILVGFVVMLGTLIGIVPSPARLELEALRSDVRALRDEHAQLLRVAQIQCVNAAEVVADAAQRTRQLHRCLTLQVSDQ